MFELVDTSFVPPEVWAAKAVLTHGNQQAAKIANKESRPLIGTDNDTPNPNAQYFQHALNWIKNRFPKCLDN